MSSPQSFASTPTYKVNVSAFAFHIDVLLLSLFALYVALTLPRALVRLFQPSEILNGFFLRSGAQRTPPERNNSTRSTRTLLRADTLGRSGTLTKSRGKASAPPMDRSPSAHKGTDPLPAIITPVARRARGAQQPSAPTRVPRWTTIVHPSLAYALNFRVSPGFSLGKLLVLVAYGLIVLYACLYRSNPFTDFDRTGYIAVSQVPIVMALAGKSNWLSWLSGVGYEKVNINQSRASLF
jgi:ferric-chelate reductase